MDARWLSIVLAYFDLKQITQYSWPWLFSFVIKRLSMFCWMIKTKTFWTSSTTICVFLFITWKNWTLHSLNGSLLRCSLQSCSLCFSWKQEYFLQSLVLIEPDRMILYQERIREKTQQINLTLFVRKYRIGRQSIPWIAGNKREKF